MLHRISLALTICGLVCLVFLTVPAFAQEPEPIPPNLMGTWVGKRSSFLILDGHFKHIIDEPLTAYIIDKQDGRLIAGEKTSKLHVEGPDSGNGEEFFGVISPDLKTVYIAEHKAGYAVFHLTGPDEMEVTYISDGSGEKGTELMASIQRLRRQ